jgi:L-alanine-DL-glutamate epimerase-like enolase superfamily enzyme
MGIRSIEPIAVSLPMLKPLIMAGETVARADNVLVRLEADDGLIGWGEAASAPTMTGETVASMVAAVNYLAPVLIGREPGDIAGACAAMEARMYANRGAKAAIEIALHDLAGRATGRPVHALLGNKRRNRLPLLGVIGGGDFDGDLADAAAKKTKGFTAFKIKVGIDGPEKDAARTRAICEVLGSGCLISADANQGFSAEQAIAFVRAVADAGLDFLEQPVAGNGLAGMAAVAAASAVAIGADEGIHCADDIARHHAQGAARGVSLKSIKLGGIAGMLEAARLADDLDMRVNVSCKTGESSIGCAAALHVAAVMPNVAWGLTLTHTGLAEDVTPTPLPVGGGFAEVPDAPGLGITVDEEKVRRFQIIM